MVFCTNCGTESPDEIRICSQCGASLGYRVDVPKENHVRLEQVYHIIYIGGLATGIIIVLAGLIWFLQQANLIPLTIEVWPFAAIIIGLMVIIGALRGIRLTS